MSSILSLDNEVKVDTLYLNNNGFTCFYSSGKLATKFVNGKRTNDYHPHQKYWRWEDTDYNLYHFYSAYLYYFPEKFIGNTKSIIGVNENVRGYVYIYVDGLMEEKYKEKIYVQSAEDIEVAKTLLRKYVDEENKNTWGYYKWKL
jgi:hypothetical protein